VKKKKLVFKNTFAPLVENQDLTVDNIIKGLFVGFIKYKDLPPEVRLIIDEEMQKRTKTPFREPNKGN